MINNNFKYKKGLMSKPINVEAQRVYKILNETVGNIFIYLSFIIEKLKVLSLLNQEFFDEILRKEEEELSNYLI